MVLNEPRRHLTLLEFLVGYIAVVITIAAIATWLQQGGLH